MLTLTNRLIEWFTKNKEVLTNSQPSAQVIRELSCILRLLTAVAEILGEEDELPECIIPLFQTHLPPLILNPPSPHIHYQLAMLLQRYLIYLPEDMVPVSTLSTILTSLMSSPLLCLQYAGLVFLSSALSTHPALQTSITNVQSLLKQIFELSSQLPLESTLAALHAVLKGLGDSLGTHRADCILSLLINWQSLLGAGSGDQDEATRLSEGRERCLEAVHSLVKSAKNWQSSPQVEEMLVKVLNQSIIAHDEFSTERIVRTLALILIRAKESGLPASISKVFPLVCYCITGKPTINAQLSTEDANLMNSFDWWRSHPLSLESTLSFFSIFVQISGANFQTMNDPFGIPYITLLIEVAKQGGKEALKNNNDFEFVSALKLLTALVDNQRGFINANLSQICKTFQELLSTSSNSTSNHNISLLLRFFLSVLYYHPQIGWSTLHQLGAAGELSNLLLSRHELLTSKKDKGRLLLGLSSLLVSAENIPFDKLGPLLHTSLTGYLTQAKQPQPSHSTDMDEDADDGKEKTEEDFWGDSENDSDWNESDADADLGSDDEDDDENGGTPGPVYENPLDKVNIKGHVREALEYAHANRQTQLAQTFSALPQETKTSLLTLLSSN